MINKYYELHKVNGEWYISNDLDDLFIGNFNYYLDSLDEASYLGYDLVCTSVINSQIKYILKRKVEKYV